MRNDISTELFRFLMHVFEPEAREVILAAMENLTDDENFLEMVKDAGELTSFID